MAEQHENDTKPHRAFGVFRQRADENQGEEFFYYAEFHGQRELQDGERRVEGFFLPQNAVTVGNVIEGEEEQSIARGFLLQGTKTGLQEAIALVQELGKASNGQPLTPGFIAFRLQQKLREKG